MILEILFWGVVVGAIYFAVAFAYVGCEVFVCLGVDVSCELFLFAAGRAGVS